MDTIVLPTAYFPPLSWWALLLKNGAAAIEVHETYPKQTYRNRACIYSANGVLSLIVPVIRTYGNHTSIADIRISPDTKWKREHWRAIESAYNKTPFFLYYKDAILDAFHSGTESLLDFNDGIIRQCLKLLNLNSVVLTRTAEFTAGNPAETPGLLVHPKKDAALVGFKHFPRYMQPFETRHGFIPNLSIADLLFNQGPDARAYLEMLNEVNPNAQS